MVVTPPANQTWRSYYYLGGKRIAMRTRYGNGNPDVVNYLHGDHLGSTSLTTNASGGLVAQARYYPYGGIRWESGTTPTDYRFTGQRSETSIGLYDYGARFYDPLLGRFISADTIVPGAGNPQSLNRYAYVLNSPLKYIDPTGHCAEPVSFAVCAGFALVVGVGTLGIGLAVMPEVSPVNGPKITDPRVSFDSSVKASGDMTNWLISQMATNATSPVVTSIRENCCTTSPDRTLGALRAFTALVGPGTVWDFKGDIAKADIKGYPNVTLGGRKLNYQAVANIHFGFVGRAAGYSSDWLQTSAGIAQIKQWVGTDLSKIGGPSSHFDQAFDNWSIRFGIFLFEQYKDNLDGLTPDAFADSLTEFIKQYGEPPPAD